MFRRLFILMFAALLLSSAPVFAQGRFVHPYGPREAVPLDRILPHIRSTHQGTFSDVDGPFADPDGRLHYRIKWLTPQGRVVWFDADARTGRGRCLDSHCIHRRVGIDICGGRLGTGRFRCPG